MTYKILLKANFKQHKKSLLSIFIIMVITSLCICMAMGVWSNSKEYIKSEIERMGYGDLTTWVSGVPDISILIQEIAARSDIKQVDTQPLIHSSYTINQQDSGSEGQLIVYEPLKYPYKFFGEDKFEYAQEAIVINSGEIYVSPSMISIYEADIGDEISFSIGRSGVEKSFVIKGFFEDPFMGSSMIGMKSFLINDEDFGKISVDIKNSGVDSLARLGAMLHLFKADGSDDSLSQWISSLNQDTSLSQVTEFAHSQKAIMDFMMLLQNIFAGFLLVFVGTLFMVALLVSGHGISNAMQRDRANMGILKAMGFTNGMLRMLQLIQYVTVISMGLILGLIVSVMIIPNITALTINTTGMMIPSLLPIGLCFLSFAVIIAMLMAFIFMKTGQIVKIHPLDAICSQNQEKIKKIERLRPITQKKLKLGIAIRQITSAKKQYISVVLVAILLVFLAGLVGRINTWLGPDGKGLMEAFNPADHHIGVQYFGDLNKEDLEKVILNYSEITDSYVLAMEGVTVNSMDYTANIIDQPSRFHIITGKTVENSEEVVLTDIAAKDLNVWIGDTVTVSGFQYKVSGIYQCANDMGANIGMSKEGYLRIGKDVPEIWCTHYFVSDINEVDRIIDALGKTYGGNVHLHENSWPGLYGIISAMKILMCIMYVMIGVVIFVVISLVSGRLLAVESRNIGIYKALGFSSSDLQKAFALRFTLTSLVGTIIGVAFGWCLTDPIVSLVTKMYGISSFHSEMSFQGVILPALVMPILFTGFSFMFAISIRKTNIVSLILER